jgi:DNA ligase (NAD+)
MLNFVRKKFYSTHIKKTIENLQKSILKHNDLYYVKAAPIISDEKYDKLFKDLENLEKEYPQYFSKKSLTQKVLFYLKLR